MLYFFLSEALAPDLLSIHMTILFLRLDERQDLHLGLCLALRCFECRDFESFKKACELFLRHV
jgi:hypothetical protein